MAELELRMPAMGESVTGGTVTAWLKKEGEFIDRDESFVSISTDKVESELPSEYSGNLLKILIAENEEVEVGQALAIIETEDVEVAKPEETKSGIIAAEPSTTSSKSNTVSEIDKFVDERFLSPVVRKIALENNLNIEELSRISSSGENGRLTKKDVLNYLKPKVENNRISKIVLNEEPRDLLKKLNPIRLRIAENLQESFQNIPHVTTFSEVDVSKIIVWRKENKENFVKKYKTPLSLVGIFMYLITSKLEDYPAFNAHFDGENILFKNARNIGFALRVSDDELLVPNIKNSEQLSFPNFLIQMQELIVKGRQNKLSIDNFQNTTFTISNTGSFGSMAGTPIIIQPQTAVLALGEIQRKPSVIIKDGKESIEIRDKMFLSLSYDHRVIDGALAAKFLSAVKQVFMGDDLNELLV